MSNVYIASINMINQITMNTIGAKPSALCKYYHTLKAEK